MKEKQLFVRVRIIQNTLKFFQIIFRSTLKISSENILITDDNREVDMNILNVSMHFNKMQ